MSVLVILDVTAAEGKVDELKQFFKEILPDTRANAGCEECRLYSDQDDPNRLAVVETFTSRPAYESYLAWRQERGDVQKLGALLAGPPSIRFLDDAGA